MVNQLHSFNLQERNNNIYTMIMHDFFIRAPIGPTNIYHEFLHNDKKNKGHMTGHILGQKINAMLYCGLTD